MGNWSTWLQSLRREMTGGTARQGFGNKLVIFQVALISVPLPFSALCCAGRGLRFISSGSRVSWLLAAGDLKGWGRETLSVSPTHPYQHFWMQWLCLLCGSSSHLPYLLLPWTQIPRSSHALWMWHPQGVHSWGNLSSHSCPPSGW